MKKKKRTSSSRRRHPYERCLDHAMARLEKALGEQNECRAKLMALEKEIPYLEGIVQALTPPKAAPEREAEPRQRRRVVGTLNIPVPDHLKHFLEPHPPANTQPSTEDEILKEPPGQALLD